MGNSEVLETRDERDWTSRCFIVATGNPSLLFPPLRDASLGPGSLVPLASLADFFSPYSPLRSLIPGYRDACGGRCSYRIWARKQPFTKTGHSTNTTWRGGYSVYSWYTLFQSDSLNLSQCTLIPPFYVLEHSTISTVILDLGIHSLIFCPPSFPTSWSHVILAAPGPEPVPAISPD